MLVKSKSVSLSHLFHLVIQILAIYTEIPYWLVAIHSLVWNQIDLNLT